MSGPDVTLRSQLDPGRVSWCSHDRKWAMTHSRTSQTPNINSNILKWYDIKKPVWISGSFSVVFGFCSSFMTVKWSRFDILFFLRPDFFFQHDSFKQPQETVSMTVYRAQLCFLCYVLTWFCSTATFTSPVLENRFGCQKGEFNEVISISRNRMKGSVWSVKALVTWWINYRRCSALLN